MEDVKINILDRLNPKDKSKLTQRNIAKKFGKYNDYVSMYLYDRNNKLIYTVNDFKDYTLPLDENIGELTNTIFINPQKVLTELGFSTGQFRLNFCLERKLFFNSFDKPFSLDEISSDRTELRVSTDAVIDNKLENLFNNFQSAIGSSIFFKDFLLDFGDNIKCLAVNTALDKSSSPFSILFKLYEPLPNGINTTDLLRLCEDIIEPLEFEVDLGEPTLPDSSIPLQGPNFRIDTRLNGSIPSYYKVYNDFLEGAASSSKHAILGKLSGSISPTIEFTNTINTDSGYHFENFTHFSSATDRLKNFKYKLELIELYKTQIDEINTIQGSVSGSAVVLNNKAIIQGKIDQIVGNLDHYEQFLYFENHPYAWPKAPDFGIGYMQITSSAGYPPAPFPPHYFTVGVPPCNIYVKPYTLMHTTSTVAIDWMGSDNPNIPGVSGITGGYGGQLYSASMYDDFNKHNLEKTVPEHVLMDSDNNDYTTFVNMVGQYFDEIWLYADHITKIREAHNSLERGISKDLVFTALQSLGIEAFDQFENEDLFEYLSSAPKDGSSFIYQAPQGQTMITSSVAICHGGNSSMAKGDITKEVWKRLYHNLPFLLKNKGTERGVRALMNCYGVPETILNVKEYGGPSSDKTTYKTFNYQKSSLALNGDSGTSGYFVKTSYQNAYDGHPERFNSGSAHVSESLIFGDHLLRFRIKPYRKHYWFNQEHDKGAYLSSSNDTSENYHLFSFTQKQQGISNLQDNVSLTLEPYIGADVSESMDYSKYGRLKLSYYDDFIGGHTYKTMTSSLIPIFDGDYYNIFFHMGTNGSSINPQKSIFNGTGSSHYDNFSPGHLIVDYQFGAHKSSFLGNVHEYWTELTGSLNIHNDPGTMSLAPMKDTSPKDLYICGIDPASDFNLPVLGIPQITSLRYSGSLQEVQFHYGDIYGDGIPAEAVTQPKTGNEGTELQKLLRLHAMEPFLYSGGSVSSSFVNLKVRLPLGSNNIQDSSSFCPDTRLNSTNVFSSMPTQSWIEVEQTHRHPTPDTVGISTTSEKTRIEEGTIDQNILSFDVKAEESPLDRAPLDYNDLGIFFSPQTEINEDIVYTLGAFRLDDYIGDPRHQTNSSYPDLSKLSKVYYKKLQNASGSLGNTHYASGSIKASSRQNFWDYIKTIQYIDHTLFKVIEQWVPAKANLKTGLLIEPNYLERTKIEREAPSMERLEIGNFLQHPFYVNSPGLPWSGSMDVPYTETNLSFEMNISDGQNENNWKWAGHKVPDGPWQPQNHMWYKSQSKHEQRPYHADPNLGGLGKDDLDQIKKHEKVTQTSTENVTYVTLWDNNDPLYGNFVTGRLSNVYYNIVKSADPSSTPVTNYEVPVHHGGYGGVKI